MTSQPNSKPAVTIVGLGRLGTALALELKRAGYPISEIVTSTRHASQRRGALLARQLKTQSSSINNARLDGDLLWLAVPDGQIIAAANALSARVDWKNKIAFHSSGALGSDELKALRQGGAAVASVHPFMTFVRRTIRSLEQVPWAIEGDPSAKRLARQIIRDFKGQAFAIRKQDKVLYHAWGTFASPLFIALLVIAEQTARRTGIPPVQARKRMLPILTQTLANYAALGPAAAFSGPLVRGDVEIIRKHLSALKSIPAAQDVYMSLSRAVLPGFPLKGHRQLQRLLR
jgi:predicted short-subunit dehydrogenase-like oxidoreductase (DUF2520 family)